MDIPLEYKGSHCWLGGITGYRIVGYLVFGMKIELEDAKDSNPSIN